MQLHRATRDRQLRTEVTRLRGCLGAVPGIGRRVLTLRAGLSGPAKSRAATASALGIAVSREARIERGALRTLQAAAAGGCGGGGITSTSGTATAGGRPAGVPALQPASFLVASTQPLMSPGSLGGGNQRVEAARASSGTQSGTAHQQQPSGRAKLVTATTSGDLGASNRTWLLILLVVFGAALAAVAAAGVRRFATASRTPAAYAPPMLVMPPRPPAAPMRPAEPIAQRPPPPAPPPEPAQAGPPADQPTQVRPQPAPPAGDTPHEPQHRTRTATMIASGIATVALRELMKRRKRH